jgi:uncharacterized GH25 family protein
MQPVAGLAFQIVPVSKVFPLHSGEPLELRIVLNGKPAVGAQVWVDYVNDPDAKPLLVDEDGRVIVKLRNQGLNVIKAEIDSDSPSIDAHKADKTQHTATLSFVLPNLPE